MPKPSLSCIITNHESSSTVLWLNAKSWCGRICLQVASHGWLWMPSALSLIYGRNIGTYVNHLTICKRGNKREIDLICSSNSSHSLNGNACRWQFSRQAWGPFAQVDTVQNKFRSRQKHARISNKDLVRLARWQITSSREIALTHSEHGNAQSSYFAQTYQL